MVDLDEVLGLKKLQPPAEIENNFDIFYSNYIYNMYHNNYKCKYCNIETNSLKKIKKHLINNHSKDQIKINYNNQCKVLRDNQCVLCKKKLDHRHYKNFHSDLKCTICKKTFKTPIKFRKHLDTHSKPWHCKHCNYKSSQWSNIKSHLINNHQNILI